jgi:CheY-like chemotaxis protein
MKVIMADNGKMAIEKLEEDSEVDLVLMDVMMPIMDGYEAIREIRKKPEYQQLPIISLTAKAMPEDRAKSISAGANDYLTKPVDIEKLLSIIHVWLYKQYQEAEI